MLPASIITSKDHMYAMTSRFFCLYHFADVSVCRRAAMILMSTLATTASAAAILAPSLGKAPSSSAGGWGAPPDRRF